MYLMSPLVWGFVAIVREKWRRTDFLFEAVEVPVSFRFPCEGLFGVFGRALAEDANQISFGALVVCFHMKQRARGLICQCAIELGMESQAIFFAVVEAGGRRCDQNHQAFRFCDPQHLRE